MAKITPSTADIIKASIWLEQHKDEICNSRPKILDLVDRMRSEGYVIGRNSMLAICKQLKIQWTPKRSTRVIASNERELFIKILDILEKITNSKNHTEIKECKTEVENLQSLLLFVDDSESSNE